MRLTRTVDPAELPVSLEEAKQYCRIEHDDENFLIESLIAAAVDYLDGPSGILGRAIIAQQWLLELDAWPNRLAVPIEPVTSVTVRYIDELGAETDVPESQLVLTDVPSARTVLEWIDGFQAPLLSDKRYPVKITITSGFGAAANVPEGIKVAIKMMVGHWYDNRETVVLGMSVAELPMAVNALLARYRVML
ncbi:head-tail connector protein [Sulfitobacter sp.]|uniref:head-tail connector protein n=1 Tax=Sulfitobacter sp. TaxID=1903071 RepID=UPI00405A1A31